MRRFLNSLFWALILIGLGFVFVRILSGTINKTNESELNIGKDLKMKVKYNTIRSYNKPVFGYLVPYDIVWRLGSKDATVISFSNDAILAGHTIKKGDYSLWVIPSKNKWTVILNHEYGQYGTAYDPSKNYLSVSLTPEVELEHQQELDVFFESVDQNKGFLVVRWENILLRIPIESIS